MASWCKYIMKLEGIDVEQYCAHSSRSAASSYAKAKGVLLKDIAVSAGWRSERTISLHFDREIDDFNIGHQIYFGLEYYLCDLYEINKDKKVTSFVILISYL